MRNYVLYFPPSFLNTFREDPPGLQIRLELCSRRSASPLAGVFTVAPGNHCFPPVVSSPRLAPPLTAPPPDCRASAPWQNLCLPFKRRDFWSTSSAAAGRGSFAFELSLVRPNSVAPRPPISAFLSVAWAASASTPSPRGAGRIVRGQGTGSRAAVRILAT